MVLSKVHFGYIASYTPEPAGVVFISWQRADQMALVILLSIIVLASRSPCDIGCMDFSVDSKDVDDAVRNGLGDKRV